jgi:hypothetical protein
LAHGIGSKSSTEKKKKEKKENMDNWYIGNRTDSPYPEQEYNTNQFLHSFSFLLDFTAI